MTITDNGRVEVDADLLARGRELTAGGRLPSKRELQRHLSKGWPVVNEVLSRLGDEAREAGVQRRRDARKTLRRLTSRKRHPGSGPVPRVRFPTVNADQVPMVLEPAAPLPAEVISEAPGKHPARRRPRSWPVVLIAFGAFVAIWSGWVDLGRLTGFGIVHPLPGIWDDAQLNTAITLPIGLEAYAAYALNVWMSGAVPAKARRFARWSAMGSLVLGFAGQAAYHLMIAAGMTSAPWWITLAVSGVPVAVLGMGAALRHLVHTEES